MFNLGLHSRDLGEILKDKPKVGGVVWFAFHISSHHISTVEKFERRTGFVYLGQVYVRWTVSWTQVSTDPSGLANVTGICFT